MWQLKALLPPQEAPVLEHVTAKLVKRPEATLPRSIRCTAQKMNVKNIPLERPKSRKNTYRGTRTKQSLKLNECRMEFCQLHLNKCAKYIFNSCLRSLI